MGQIETFARRYVELAVCGYVDDAEAIAYHSRLLDVALVPDDHGPRRSEPEILLPRDKARAYILSSIAAQMGIAPKRVQGIMHCTHAQALQFINEVLGR